MATRRMAKAPSFMSTPAWSMDTAVGAATWPTWVFRGWGPNTYGQVLGQISVPPAFDPRPLIFTTPW